MRINVELMPKKLVMKRRELAKRKARWDFEGEPRPEINALFEELGPSKYKGRAVAKI